MTTHDAGRALTGDFPADQEWYPNECAFCTREAALECTDPSCRARRLGEDRVVPPGGDGR
jgi:hypothetical protein